MMQANAIADRRVAPHEGRQARGEAAGHAGVAQSEPLQPVPHAEEAEGAEADREHQHHALEERLPERVEVEDEEQVADGAEGERAENRADGAAGPAEERNAAEHDRGDREERIGVAARIGRLAGIGEEGEVEPADRRRAGPTAYRPRTSPAGSARPTCRRRPPTSRPHRRPGRSPSG